MTSAESPLHNIPENIPGSGGEVCEKSTLCLRALWCSRWERAGSPISQSACNVHPWMHSYIAVFKHAFFAVTGKGGSFDLKNLPPGNYTVIAWHEKLGTATQ